MSLLPRRDKRCPLIANGFTLIELLVVITIIAVLAGLLFPALKGAMETSRGGACAANLKQIGVAMLTYAVDNGGRLPGSGSYSPTASANWQDAISVLLGSKSSSQNILQRVGDKPTKGKIYCPSMKPWGTSPRYPRAYVANYNAIVGPNNTNETASTYGVLTNYKPGAMLNTFSRHSQTVLVMESERSGDAYQPSASGPIVLADGKSGPDWASNDNPGGGNFAFRHNGRINVLFMDGHVEGRTLEQAQDLNQVTAFKPD